MATRTLSFGNISFGGETYRVSVEVTAAGDKCPTQDKASEITALVQGQIRNLLGSHARMYGAANPRKGPLPLPNKFIINETGVEYVSGVSSRGQAHKSDTQAKAEGQWKAFEERFISKTVSSATADPSGAVEVPAHRSVTANVSRADIGKPRQESKQALQRSDSERSFSELSLPDDQHALDDAPPERQDSGLGNLFQQAKAMLTGAPSKGKPGMLLHEKDNGTGEVPAEVAPDRYVQGTTIPVPTEYRNGQPGTAFMKPAGQTSTHRRSSERDSSEGPSRPTHLDTLPGKKGKSEKVKSTLPAGYEYDQALWKRFRDLYGAVIDRRITLQGLIEKLGEEHEDVATLKQAQAICKAEHVFGTKQKERANGQAAQTGKPLGLADRVDQGPTLDEVTRQVLRYHVKMRDEEMAASLQRSYSNLSDL